jgi:hypothetical protein
VTSDLRAHDGQASLEWVAVVALVATLLGLGAALAEAGFVGRRVTREMARALCLVSAGDCRRDQEPCVTRAQDGKSSLTFNALLVRLGSRSEALIEQRSDGTVAVTKVEGGVLGLEGGFGADAKMKALGIDLAVGGELQASALARRERGRTWIVPDWAAAQRLLGRLRPLHGGAPRSPDIEYGGRDLAGAVSGSLAADGLVHLDAARGSLSFDRSSGTRIDRRTGRRTVFVQARADAQASLAGGVLGLSASTAGELYAVELDRAGRPVDLRVVAAGSFAGSADLPGVVAPVVGLLQAGTAEGRVFEVTAHLDLTDAENLAAARGLLDAVARRGWSTELPAASRALRRRLDERGTVEARVLESRSTSDDLAVHGALGGKVGADVHAESTATRLIAAASRGLDGRWLVREDCVARA